MKRFLLILFLLSCMTATPIYAVEAGQVIHWEKSSATIHEKPSAISDEAELYTKGQTLIVRTQKKITVRIMNILGQTITQAEISPGTYEAVIGMHGIFIVVAGDRTFRIAL